MSFVFSADGHVVEPSDLFEKNLPPSLLKLSLYSEVKDGMLTTYAGGRVTGRKPLETKPRLGPDGQPFGRPDRRGNREIEPRLADMKLDGIDAEVPFPSLGLTAFMISDPEAELATAQTYNDWLHGLLKDHTENFVRCGIVPVRNAAYAVQEMERLAKLGFTSAMIPSIIDPLSGLPEYTSEAWDPVFEAAQRLGIVFCLHTGTGRYNVRSFKGPGGAVMNYGIQSVDGWITFMAMVSGGLLDRYPGAHVCVIEGGASWLGPLAERMDEVYEAHSNFVSPKLSLRPSEIVARQLHCQFQTDRAGIMARKITGTQALIWGSDYPHHEGTFPNSKKVIAELFDGIDISEQEKADILGLNAGRLFRLPHPAVLAAG